MLGKLYLEDLEVGQEFLSEQHHLDAEQIIAYASRFDPQVFHLDAEAAKDTFFQGLPPAAGTYISASDAVMSCKITALFDGRKVLTLLSTLAYASINGVIENGICNSA